MNPTKIMHDLGIKITNDIMDPILKDFNDDIKRVEEKLDRVIELLVADADAILYGPNPEDVPPEGDDPYGHRG